MNSSELLVLFKDQLLQFTDELLEIFENEPKLILLRVYIENNLEIEPTVSKFNKAICGPLDLKEMIKNRNAKFFMEYDLMKLNNNSEQEQANFMLQLWDDQRLEDEDKETIWKWVDLFVSIAGCYSSKKEKE